MTERQDWGTNVTDLLTLGKSGGILTFLIEIRGYPRAPEFARRTAVSRDLGCSVTAATLGGGEKEDAPLRVLNRCGVSGAVASRCRV